MSPSADGAAERGEAGSAAWSEEEGADPGAPGCRVEVIRASEVESVHLVDAVVCGTAPDEEIHFGDPHRLTFFRSSFKPFQALPLVSDGAASHYELTPEELALCSASHAGTPEHVRVVEGLLERIGASEEALACGPQEPFDREAARTLVRRDGSWGRLHNNCSGKHAGMLMVARHAGWPTDGYEERDHPVQERIRQELSAWIDVDPGRLAWGVDGCGVPTPYLSVRQMSRAYARLGRASREGERAPRAVVDAMTSHPRLVAGDGRLTTRLMEAVSGRILAKEGAEGVLCMAGPDEGWGLALKVRDGNGRARGPAGVEILAALDLVSEGERQALAELRRTTVRNTADAEVGGIEARVSPDVTYTPRPL